MEFLISGGAGFIGSHLVDQLVELGHRPTVIDNLSTGRLANVSEGAYFPGPMDVSATPEELISPETVAIHLAANPRCNVSIYVPEDDARRNYLEGLIFFTKCMAARVRRFVFISSMSVYGKTTALPYHEEMTPNPLDPYAVNKWALEKMCLIMGRANNVEIVILRPQNVFGPRQRPDLSYRNVIPRWIRRLLNEQPLPVMGSLKLRRSFSPVSLISRGIVAAAMKPGISGEIFNLGSPQPRELGEIANVLQGYTQKEPRFTLIPSPSTLLEESYGSVDKASKLLGVDEKDNEFEDTLKALVDEIVNADTPDITEEILNPELLHAEFNTIYKFEEKQEN